MAMLVAVPRLARTMVWLLPQEVRGRGVRRRVYRPDGAGFMTVHHDHLAEMLRQGCVLVGWG